MIEKLVKAVNVADTATDTKNDNHQAKEYWMHNLGAAPENSEAASRFPVLEMSAGI